MEFLLHSFFEEFRNQSNLNFKELGNRALEKGDYEKAIALYSSGIEKEPDNYQLYSNRSLAYFKLGKYDNAKQDANEVITLNPKFIKGYFRRANALLKLRKPSLGIIDVLKGLELEPNNEELKKLLNTLKQSLKDDFWRDEPFLLSEYIPFDKESLLYQKILIYPDKIMNQEDIKKLLLNEKDIPLLIYLSRNQQLLINGKIKLIFQLLTSFEYINCKEEEIEFIAPLLFYSGERDETILDSMILFFAKLKTKSFKYLKDITFKKQDFVKSSRILKKMFKLYPNDKEIQNEFKKVFKTQMNRILLKKYFKYNKDLEYLEEIKNLLEKNIIKEDESFSFIDLCYYQDYIIDEKNYPFMKSECCNKPLRLCQKELIKSFDNYDQTLERIKKEFENKNYLQVFKLSFHLNSRDSEISFYFLKSLILLNKKYEAFLLLDSFQLNQNHLLDLYNDFDKMNETKVKSENYHLDFDLNFKNIIKLECKGDRIIKGNNNGNVYKNGKEYFFQDFNGSSQFLMEQEIYDDDDEETHYLDDEYLYGFYKNKIFKYNLLLKKRFDFTIPCGYDPRSIFVNSKNIILRIVIKLNKYNSFYLIYDKNTFQYLNIIPISHSSGQHFYQDSLFQNYHQIIFETDIETGDLKKTFILSREEDDRICLDDQFLVSYDNQDIDIFDRNTTELYHHIQLKDDYFKIKLCGGYLFTSNSEFIEIYNLITKQKVHKIENDSNSLFNIILLNKEIRILSSKWIIIPIEKDYRVKICHFCKMKLLDIKPKLCGKCYKVIYCSKECQLKDWKEHKLKCL